MASPTLRQCPLCGRVVSGTSALISHMKACKQRLCTICDERDACPKERRLYFVECENAIKIANNDN